jgi:competence protein ComEA
VPAPDAAPTRLHAAADALAALRRDPRRFAGVVAATIVIVVLVAVALRPEAAASPPGAAPPDAGAARRGGEQVSSPSESTASPPSTVVVHVAGAVVRPGVVSLPASDRVVDALDAAGGPRADADPDQLDLAARLTDGSRIYVPRRGEVVAPVAPSPGGDAGAGATAAPGPVHLNTASAAELEALPGVGPSLAQAIVSERARLGGFRRIDDLRRVRGIGDRRFEQLRPLVAL